MKQISYCSESSLTGLVSGKVMICGGRRLGLVTLKISGQQLKRVLLIQIVSWLGSQLTQYCAALQKTTCS